MPSLRDQVKQQQQKQKTQYDRRSANRSFQQGDSVLANNFRLGYTNNSTWLSGKNLKVAGPLSYEIKLSNDQIIRRHTDHICPSEVNSGDISITMSDNVLDDVLPFTCQPSTSGCRRSQRDQCPP